MVREMNMQVTEDAVLETIYQALRALNAERAADAQIALAPTTCLFGEASVLDSLSLVSVIVDLETHVSDAFGKSVSLTDDRAMSRDPVPFTDVTALQRYLLELLAE
jgi:acyl carrier protein